MSVGNKIACSIKITNVYMNFCLQLYIISLLKINVAILLSE